MEDHAPTFAVRIRKFLAARGRLTLAGCLLAGVFLLSLLAVNQSRPPVHQNALPFAPGWASPNGAEISPGAVPIGGDNGGAANMAVPPRLPSASYKAGPVDSANSYHEPRIAYSAELSVVTREFAHSRSNMEEILERHRGYTARLRMVGQSSGSVLTATLRVPSSEYRPALMELKGVGLLEHEEEAADEISQQHSELEARLVNAQNEEQRILRLLQDKDKTDDAAALQRQVALLRGDIERMQAERYSSDRRATFANISFSLREERTPPAQTIAAKLRSAAAGGLSDAFESISTILLLLASRGPLLALWVVLLYFPTRYLWRRRSRWAFSEAESSKNS